MCPFLTWSTIRPFIDDYMTDRVDTTYGVKSYASLQLPQCNAVARNNNAADTEC